MSNLVYELPSFQRWGKAANLVLGDWQLNGIASYFGATIDVITGVNTIGTAAAVGQRPNYTGRALLDTGDSTRHLNPAAFSTSAGSAGTLGKRGSRKAITNIDFSLGKNWKVKEKYRIQFRAEFFNLLNHPNFVGFDTDLRNGASAR